MTILSSNPHGGLQKNIDPKRILIVKLSSIGDVVHTLPALSALRKQFPRSYIAWVVKKHVAGIIIGHPYLDKVIIYEDLIKAIREIRRLKFDLAIDFQGLFRSGFITFASGAKIRLGFSRANSQELSRIFINHKITPREEDRHVIDKNLSLLRPLGIEEVKKKEFIISVSEREREYIANFLREENIGVSEVLVGLHPGTSWPTKCWIEKGWADLADRLLEELKVKPIFLWGPGEEELVDRIVKMMRNKPLVSCRINLKELVCLLSKCRLFVGGETGPLHIACAVNIPTVALIGPTDSVRNGPYGQGHIILEKDLPCRRCWKYSCRRLDCMNLITPDEVFSAVERQLQRV
jgi:lipopolysaccharide heptosyltransferase I